ncbi:MAG: hypothetical protein AB7T49_12115 [Oligoflexales bacterium]
MQNRKYKKIQNYVFVFGLLPFLLFLTLCGKKSSHKGEGITGLNKNFPKNWSVNEDWAGNPFALKDLD